MEAAGIVVELALDFDLQVIADSMKGDSDCDNLD